MGKIKEFLKSKQSLVKSVIATIIFGVILSMGLNLAWAWIGPTAIAPGGNIAAPLNTGGTAQIKTGVLTIAGNLIGNGGITTSSLTSNGPASINGTLTLSNGVTINGALTSKRELELILGSDLNMSGKNIFGVNSIKGVSLNIGYWTKYDADNDNLISKTEAGVAGVDYFNNAITKKQMMEVYDRYAADSLWDYDSLAKGGNNDGIIEKNEAARAVVDYFEGITLKETAVAVVNQFLFVDGPKVLLTYDISHDGINPNGIIEKPEAIKAVTDFFSGIISKEQAIEVVKAYQGKETLIYPDSADASGGKLDGNLKVTGCIRYNGGTLGTCK